jgi:hypothetical protein
LKTLLEYNLWGIAKAKASVESRNAFYAGYLYIKIKRIFAKFKIPCYNAEKRNAKFKIRT